MDEVFKLPGPVRRDLVIALVAKLAMLALLYGLFFSPSHRAAIDVAARIGGPVAGR